jgi:hypothetical protein
MTTDESTPETGTGSIDLADGWPPLRDEPDEQVAGALEVKRNEARELTERLRYALVDDEGALTDEDVDALLALGNDLRGLAANLAHRVPREGMCEQRVQEEGEGPVDKSVDH